MTKTCSVLAAALLACASSLAVGQPGPVAVFDLPAGEACSFPLHVELYGARSVYREHRDKNGEIVRVFTGGKGYELRFTNSASGSGLTLRPNGSNDTMTYNADGTVTLVTTGHYVLIYFSTDVASGGTPFVRQYTGRTVQNINPSTGVFTLLRTSGKASDICAALEG